MNILGYSLLNGFIGKAKTMATEELERQLRNFIEEKICTVVNYDNASERECIDFLKFVDKICDRRNYPKFRIFRDINNHVFFPKDSRNIIRLDKHTWLMLLVKSVTKGEGSNAYTVTQVDAYFIGKNGDKYVKAFKKDAESRYKSRPQVIAKNGCYKELKCKPLSSIVSDKKKEITDYIDNWLNSKEYYNKYGIPYKTGILLYGPPGTGKTSLVKAIASKYNFNIVVYDGGDNALDRLETCCSVRNTIVLIEEINTFTTSITETSKSRDNNDSSKNKQSLYFKNLLQLLDGVDSLENVIFIATTNYIEDLDPALIRPGRFNLTVELGLMNRKNANKMCDMYDIDRDILDTLELPIQPAKLENILMQTILNKYNIQTGISEEAVENSLLEKEDFTSKTNPFWEEVDSI